VATIPVIVAKEVSDQSPGMGFVEDDDMVEQVGAQGETEPLADAVLPGRPVRGADGCRTGRFQPCGDAGEFRVPVVDEVLDGRGVEEDLPELLIHPGGRRIGGDVEVEDAAAIMVDDDEAVKDLEGRRSAGFGFHVARRGSHD